MSDLELQIKKNLTNKQAQINLQLKTLETQDPVLADTTPEASELGTDAWQADVHAKLVVVKNNLQTMSVRIKQTLNKINLGLFGKCDRCGLPIEPERLQAMPTAELCLACISSRSN